MYIAPSQSWDVVSQLHSIPFSLRSAIISFDSLGTISHSELFIECVEDDIEVAKGVTASDHYIDTGMYLKGDLIKCNDLHIINGEGSVCVINNTGGDISIPMGNVGSRERPANGTFIIKPGNKKYKLRCFASQTPLPDFPEKQNYWDKTITGVSTNVSQKKITIPHGLGVVPDMVEINFVIKVTSGLVTAGDIIPLKFLGGSRHINYTHGFWTTSADKDNVYLAVPTDRISVKIAGSTYLNLCSSNFASITVNLRKSYPNPYKVVFQDFALKATQLNNKGAIDSPKIEYFSGSGEVLESDLIIENRTPNTGTSFGQGQVIYYNQCGGTIDGTTDYMEESSYIFHDHALSEKQYNNSRISNPAPVIRDYSPDIEKPNYLRFKSSPSEKKGGMVFYDWGKSKYINIWEDSASDWVATHRWQYESSSPTSDSDTGWLDAGQYGMQYPNLSVKFSELWGDDAPPSKVDIFLRMPIDGFNDMPLGATWSLANMKGGAQCFSTDSNTLVMNDWAVAYNSTSLKALPGGVPSIPNSTVDGDSSGNSFDSGKGTLQYRIRVYA